MSNTLKLRGSLELLKTLLRRISEGGDVKELMEEARVLLKELSPAEIILAEQQLVAEGIDVREIMRVCDLHLELVKDYLRGVELKDVPEGHPLDYLLRENDYIIAQAELLGLYAAQLLKLAGAGSTDALKKTLTELQGFLRDLYRKSRLHYRKIQMLIFPYIERRGFDAIPRVLWNKEDGVIRKIRELVDQLNKILAEGSIDSGIIEKIAGDLNWIARELVDIAFREDKILFPTTWILFSEGEWTVVHEIGEEIGYIVEARGEWKPSAKPVYPYEVEANLTPEILEKLPASVKSMVKEVKPDSYRIEKDSDLKLETGFLTEEEVEGIFKALPLEVTYANIDDRIRFYSKSMLSKGFVRTKTIIGRQLYYCHPPRLEALVRQVVKQVKTGEKPYREFWTKQGDRIIRVLITPVTGRDGRIIGALEVVEDLTEIVRNPEEVLKKIVVL